MRKRTHDSNMQEVHLAKLREEYDEIKQDIDFALQSRQALDVKLETLRERRFQLRVDIAGYERHIPASTVFHRADIESDKPLDTINEPRRGLEERLMRLEKLIQDINRRLATDTD